MSRITPLRKLIWYQPRLGSFLYLTRCQEREERLKKWEAYLEGEDDDDDGNGKTNTEEEIQAK